MFLNRCLTYVNYKRCRAKKPKRRSSARISTLHSIIEKLAEQKRGEKLYMTLTLFGLFCEEIAKEHHAEVQVFHKETQTKVSAEQFFFSIEFELIFELLSFFLSLSNVVNINYSRHQSQRNAKRPVNN